MAKRGESEGTVSDGKVCAEGIRSAGNALSCDYVAVTQVIT